MFWSPPAHRTRCTYYRHAGPGAGWYVGQPLLLRPISPRLGVAAQLEAVQQAAHYDLHTAHCLRAQKKPVAPRRKSFFKPGPRSRLEPGRAGRTPASSSVVSLKDTGILSVTDTRSAWWGRYLCFRIVPHRSATGLAIHLLLFLMQILEIIASPRGAASYSTQLARGVV